MVKKAIKPTRSELAGKTKRRKKSHGIEDDEERISREAIKYLLFNHGGLLVPTAIRETRIKGFPVWILTVTLRYPTGHEGYVGDLLYDGEQFTFLTDQSVMDERVRRLAGDPERVRKWHEYGRSPVQAGKR